MALPFIPELDAATLSRAGSDSISLKARLLNYLGSALITATTDNLTQVSEWLRANAAQRGTSVAVHCDVSALHNVEDIIDLLDRGVSKAFVTFAQLSDLESHGNVDLDRIVLKLDSTKHQTKREIVDAIGDTTVGVYSHQVQDVALLEDWLKEYGPDRPPVYFSLAGSPADDTYWNACVQLTQSSATPIVSGNALTEERVTQLLNLKSDRPDGLISTLVTDERGVALGLVYSTVESVQESLKTGRGVYQSRKRGLWYKGDSSGDIQELARLQVDCDSDCLKFVVRQKGRGFCHLGTSTCFGQYSGLSRLQQTLVSRKTSAPEGSYTARLFSSPPLLKAKIMEEAEELCNASTPEDVAFEAADLVYFAMTKCVAAGVSLEDVEKNLDAKSVKVKRRKGDAKGDWAKKEGLNGTAAPAAAAAAAPAPKPQAVEKPASKPGRIQMRYLNTTTTSPDIISEALKRPSQKLTDSIMGIVKPIIQSVQERGDPALLEYTHKFDKATSLTSAALKGPYPANLMQISRETAEAIDISYENIRRFHAAQREDHALNVETMPGVVCSRFSRPIERVGLYVPGGTAVLPSSALMLGVPAMVAGCKKIVLASPPRPDGSISPEIVYIAHKIGAESIVLAGGAQAVAAMAYGTQTVSKVDKILGPGNQFVTAAKMVVSNDTSASVSIDMPAGPSEVLVIADSSANPDFVASDLLSQAEHGHDSQVILIGIGLTEVEVAAINDALHAQAMALPRVDIVRGAIDHSVTFVVKDVAEAFALSNQYAPEHLILQIENAAETVKLVDNAGSVFVGPWTPESVGDYSAGVNHSLPTYGYARQYSGVNLGSYIKHITSSELTAQGLVNVGGAVMQLAKAEQLEAHRRAVEIRLNTIKAGAT